MEATVDKLEAMFQKAESDINYISRKLDSEFSNTQDEQLNPNKTLQKIGEIKKEYGELVKEAQAIQEAQKEAAEFFKTQLLTVCQAVQNLENQSGMDEAEKTEELLKLEELLGIPLQSKQSDTGGASSSTSAANDVSEDTVTLSQPTVLKQVDTVQPLEQVKVVENSAPIQSAVERRSNSEEFIEITEDEFISVSELVRRRVKLADVNSVYMMLWTHFKEEKNCELLSPGEMFKMGMRVTGATGEAKLKVLRALKLLHISNKGDVKLL